MENLFFSRKTNHLEKMDTGYDIVKPPHKIIVHGRFESIRVIVRMRSQKVSFVIKRSNVWFFNILERDSSVTSLRAHWNRPGFWLRWFGYGFLSRLTFAFGGARLCWTWFWGARLGRCGLWWWRRLGRGRKPWSVFGPSHGVTAMRRGRRRRRRGKGAVLRASGRLCG